MRLDIRYTTRFRYAGQVSESQNELRACPSNDAHQQLVHYDVTTTPSSRVSSYNDYWGTRVDTFGVRAPHGSLEVVAKATVETSAHDPSPDAIDPELLRDQRFVDGHLEFLQRSPHVSWGEPVAAAARECARAADGDLIATVMNVHERASAMDYRSGSTYVGVDVDEVFTANAGVCQDFAHLAIAMYRELGFPARYVSGFLFTVDDSTGEDSQADEVEVETHAWVEVALPGAGWLALDPTNSQRVGERHVAIGRGRDYDDVAPFRGVFSGGHDHELDVEVTMRRLSREPIGGVPGSDRLRAQQGQHQQGQQQGQHGQGQHQQQ